MNIKKICVLAILLIGYCSTYAQSTIKNKQLIGITPIVCTELELPSNANRAITQKLAQMATKNGFGTTSGAIVLTANPVIVDKQLTTTTPQQYVVDIDLSLYVLNMTEDIIVSEITVPLKGIDRSVDRALMSAVRNLNSSNVEIRNFMNQARVKIINYYQIKAPAMLEKASSMADRGDYEGAMSLLSSIPDFVDISPAVTEMMTQIHNKEKGEIEAAAQDSLSRSTLELNSEELSKAVAKIIL